MKILSFNPGHDGAVVLVQDGCLSYVAEGEKDSGRRYSEVSLGTFINAVKYGEVPDVVASTGSATMIRIQSSWEELKCSINQVDAGYFEEGESGKTHQDDLLFGRPLKRFSSTHVRSHIMCSYGLSPFPQNQPCYALIWEGLLGSFYYIDSQIAIRKICDVLVAPGNRYSLLYGIADPKLPMSARNWIQIDNAGKLMAIAAYGSRRDPTAIEQQMVDLMLNLDIYGALCHGTRIKESFKENEFFNVGVESQSFKDLAWQFSNSLFNLFLESAQRHLTNRLPLLIAGGCGLNCDWNSRWRESGLFTDVFVPPCANDSGVAVGTAIDALHHYTGRAKIVWDVYVGDRFNEDVEASDYFRSINFNLKDVCSRLLKGEVIGWVQGRYEMGPRALGNRSLIASPFSLEMRNRLNSIKQREPFRPIAPICLEEDFSLYFDPGTPSPHMLYFQRVKDVRLQAVTHVDGSARAQSVNDTESPKFCALLREFRKQSGVGVLCNTSLNFSGRGFINRLSHLFTYAVDRGIDGLVVGERFWVRKYGDAVDRYLSA